VDIDERKRVTAEEARPFKDRSTRKAQEAAQWKQRLKELKKARPSDEAAIAEADTRVTALTKEARELARRAQDIEDAVYDVKAVNPNKRPVVDTRTPEELLNIIETKGKEIGEALATLRNANRA